jgi:sugar phosphate isomerase/epimerase
MVDDRLELCWATLAGADLPTLITAAESADLHAITVAPMKFGQFVESGGRADEVRARLRDAGVRVTGVDALMKGLPGAATPDRVPSKFAAGFDYDEDDCYRIADEVGAESLNIAHFLGSPVPVGELVEAIGAIRARASAHGLRTTLEFIPGGGVPDVRTAFDIVSEIGAPDLAIMVDTWHLARSGGGPADLARLPSGAIGGMQISDRVEPPAGEPYVPGTGRLLPGDGALPLGEILEIAAHEDPPVNFGLEVISAEMDRLTATEAARRVADAMRALLRRLNI